MAYNKSKHAEAAQKFLQQGKVAQAIGEYQQMLKNEPKDQLTLMTIGDLFVRQGETFQALEYFERLAQIFLAEGFVSKAIAIYKKIAKLAPEETRPIERLAELYVQQGVLSEARPIYLQLAELHQRAGRQAQAVALLRKLLDAEPDNLRVQVRLAELSLAMGAPADAVAGFRAAAELMQRRGEHAEGLKYADRALKVDPDDLPTFTLKALILSASDRRSDAVALLQSLPSLEEGGEPADMLIDFYLEAEEADRAVELSRKIFVRDAAHFAPALRVAEALFERNDLTRCLALLDLTREAATDAGQHEQVSEFLNRIIERHPDRLEPQEWLVEFYGRTSDSFHLPDALAALAQAYDAAGDRERAEQVRRQLSERDPENKTLRRPEERIRTQMGLPGDAAPEAAEPQAARQASAAGEPSLDPDTQRVVTQALTDADLFSSYGLTQKAIELLGTVLEREPNYVPALERLLDLHLGEGNERRTAALALQLERIHNEQGDTAAAERFGELRRRFEGALGPAEPVSAGTAAPVEEFAVTPAAPAPPETAEPAPETQSIDAAIEELMAASPLLDANEAIVEEAPSESEAAAPAAPEAEAVQEVDLSEEWAALAGQVTEAMGAPAAGSGAEAEAEKAAESPASQPEGEAEKEIPAFEVPAFEVSAAEPEAASAAQETPEAVPEGMLEPGAEKFFSETPEEEPEMAAARAEETGGESELSADDLLNALTIELEETLPENEPEAAAQAEAGAEAIPQAQEQAQEQAAEAGALAEEISLDDILKEAQVAEPVEQPAASAEPEQAAAAASEPGDGLSEMFEEFRAALDDITESGEDLETHYNLGIAYREMGLVDEAISEFQKVAKANKKGEAFRYAMQCCTLLGLAFMEKSQPSIAAMWYERALEIPGLDQESILALRYDLGVAQELAGDTTAARRSFSQVYGMNIDYRDVAERLAALGNGN